ncbi:hypothetical protein CAK78_12660 [Aeromonas sp. A35_P]|uniref:PLP-dependent transferase n=1 Tax=Aeromonas sp. A35_P TaxID=1983805 RepID=UPI000B9B4DE2|nr:PLP-dependent transferase [Aeromonas sp. A35_P]OZG41570.1 hypothetical protein CAK78_12660 [Aeromonas sp. A35_P]
MKDATLALHHGFANDPTTKAVAVPIYQTVAYEFESAQHGADLFNLAVPGNIYTRIMNPTNDVLEQRMAALEGGIAALVVSAGSAAITYAIQALTAAGDNIVSTPQLYGGTYTLFAHMLPSFGVEVRFYDALKIFKRLVNIGDAKSLACHPASTTHRQLSEEEQAKAGVKPEMIRLSVGIEAIEDILADLDQALEA